ncbi:MAG: TrbC/VirB2 family protein [Burkholderia gladioli]
MKKHLQPAQLAVGLVTLLVATQAFAVDTGSSSLNSLHTWLLLWIPMGCIIIIMALGVGVLAHFIKLHQLVNPVIGLIIIGAASTIAGFFGLGT